MTNFNGSWKPVSKGEPCPACGHADWCAWTPDGKGLRCMRGGDTPSGMRLVKSDADGGTLFVVHDPLRNGSARAGRATKCGSRPSFDALLKQFRAALTAERREGLAAELGVTAASLDMIGVGWATADDLRLLKASGAGWREDQPDGAFAFPERDGGGRVIGFALRALDGRKGAPSSEIGAKRGQIVPATIQDARGPVLIVEGASDVAACIVLGLAAIGRPSNSGGAEYLARLLKRRAVLVVGENDSKPTGAWPGRDGAEAIAARLASDRGGGVLWALPPAPDKDVRAWLATRVAAGLDLADTDACFRAGQELLTALRADVTEAEPQPSPRHKHKRAVQPIQTYRPFPVETLPDVVRDFVIEAADAIGCDRSFVALPMLGCLARAIGNRRVIRLKRTWDEPAIIWAAIVGKSGTAKSPAIEAVMCLLERKQSAAISEHCEAMLRYEQERARYEADLAAWRRQRARNSHSNERDQAPWEPKEPFCERYIVCDITIEALADRLADQFDGVLLVRDELAGWVNGIAEYKGGRGSDNGHWLACWSASPLTMDRKTGARKVIRVPRAAVSIVGGIQPAILRQAIGREHMHDGLCARLLLSMPEPRPVRWSEAVVSSAMQKAMEELVEQLLATEPAADADGNPQPFPLTLNAEAKALWSAYYDRHRAEQSDLDDDLSAAWSKLEAYTARFALMFALCRDPKATTIDQQSVADAITLSDWFGGEARRVYGTFAEDEEARELRELAEWIRLKGGEVTVRQVQQGRRDCTTAEEAETKLHRLVAAGVGEWRSVPPSPKGGQPTRRFRLYTPSPVYATDANTEENVSNVDVDNVDDDENEVAEWTN